MTTGLRTGATLPDDSGKTTAREGFFILCRSRDRVQKGRMK